MRFVAGVGRQSKRDWRHSFATGRHSWCEWPTLVQSAVP
ncbi:hypothetical protein X962_4112 [Burkholderia pseudomallei MSHR7343]|nr:hypothetical protein X962_4112 [Burkholderia pseudomallei MSHR7343]